MKTDGENGPGTGYFRAASNRITRVQDFAGRAVTYTYTSAGYLTPATHPDGIFEECGYDSSKRKASARNRRGEIMATNALTTGTLSVRFIEQL